MDPQKIAILCLCGVQCPVEGFDNLFAEIQKGGLTTQHTLHFTLTLWTKCHKIQIDTRHSFKLFTYMNSHNNKVTETAGKYILLSTFNPYPETPTLYSWNHLDHQPLSI